MTKPCVGDVVQITQATHHWFPALLIVDEVKSWGVIAICLIPTPGPDTNAVTLKKLQSCCAQAPIRLATEVFAVIGKAEVMLADQWEKTS